MHCFRILPVVLLLIASGNCMAENATTQATAAAKPNKPVSCCAAPKDALPGCVTGSCPAERAVAADAPHTTADAQCHNDLDKKPLQVKRTAPPQHQPKITAVVKPPKQAPLQSGEWTPATKLPAVVACPPQVAKPSQVSQQLSRTFQLQVQKMPRPQRGMYAATLQEHHTTQSEEESLDHLNKAALHLEAAGLEEEAKLIRDRIKLAKNRLTRELIRTKTAQLQTLQAEIKRLQGDLHPRQVTVAATIAEIPAGCFPSVKRKIEEHLYKKGLARPDITTVLKELYGKEVRVLSQPVIKVLEGQPGELQVGRASPWIPVNYNASQSIVQPVAALEHGLYLEVKPVVKSTGNVELRARLQVTTHNAKANRIQEVLDQSFQPLVAHGKTVAILTRPHHYVSEEAYLANKGKCYLITLKPTLSHIGQLPAPVFPSY